MLFRSNVTLNDTVEFLAQVSADIPQDDEGWAFSATLGVILTLPGAGHSRYRKPGQAFTRSP